VRTPSTTSTGALIAPAELSTAFGQTFDAGTLTHHDQMGSDQCIWKVADPMSAAMVSLTVQRDSSLPDELHDNGMDVERLFDESRRLMYEDGVDLAWATLPTRRARQSTSCTTTRSSTS
jgi:hypothetical protein